VPVSGREQGAKVPKNEAVSLIRPGAESTRAWTRPCTVAQEEGRSLWGSPFFVLQFALCGYRVELVRK
jgi:hypothetical protein